MRGSNVSNLDSLSSLLSQLVPVYSPYFLYPREFFPQRKWLHLLLEGFDKNIAKSSVFQDVVGYVISSG